MTQLTPLSALRCASLPERRAADVSEKCQTLSARMCGASMALYLIWLLLPAVQTTGRAMTGAACVALFAVGAVLDWTYFKANFIDLFLRAACAVLLPLGLRVFMNRGGTNFAGFYVQQVMFWFPLIFAGYARRRGDRRLWKSLKWILLLTVAVTVCTTIGWHIQGMLRGGRIYAYSRSLGYAGEGREAYLKELMLRNIGGYDFVYAMVAALPLTCILIQQHKGAKRGAFILQRGNFRFQSGDSLAALAGCAFNIINDILTVKAAEKGIFKSGILHNDAPLS